PCLGELRDGIYRLTAAPDGHDNRRAGIIIVPQIVVNGLELPYPLPGPRIERQRAVCRQVVTGPIAAIVVRRARAGCAVHDPALLIDREPAPGIRAAAPQPAIALPAFVKRLAGARNGMEAPDLAARAGVERTDVARSVRLALGV